MDKQISQEIYLDKEQTRNKHSRKRVCIEGNEPEDLDWAVRINFKGNLGSYQKDARSYSLCNTSFWEVAQLCHLHSSMVVILIYSLVFGSITPFHANNN